MCLAQCHTDICLCGIQPMVSFPPLPPPAIPNNQTLFKNRLLLNLPRYPTAPLSPRRGRKEHATDPEKNKCFYSRDLIPWPGEVAQGRPCTAQRHHLLRRALFLVKSSTNLHENKGMIWGPGTVAGPGIVGSFAHLHAGRNTLVDASAYPWHT